VSAGAEPGKLGGTLPTKEVLGMCHGWAYGRRRFEERASEELWERFERERPERAPEPLEPDEEREVIAMRELEEERAPAGA
jgi:hypothetical protein